MTRPPLLLARRLLVGLAALLWAGCAAAPPRVVSVAVDPREPAPVTAKTDDETLLRVVAGVLVTRLGVPLTPPIRAYFFSSQKTFEKGLVDLGQVPGTVARDQASYAIGVGTGAGILLRGDKLRRGPLALRAGVFAHELTHIGQHELGGGRRGVSEQWLREGFADWAKFRALDALGIRPYAESRNAMLDAVRQATASTLFPDLDELAANRDWIATRIRLGGMATYGQAFLATDRLVERVGREAVVEYFRQAAGAKDRGAVFRAAFQMPREEFVADFRRYVAALGGRPSERPTSAPIAPRSQPAATVSATPS